MESLQAEILSIKYEVWHIEKLIPYARNPRKNDHVVDEMAGKIKEYGMPVPICIRPDGGIVDGHLRYKALKKLGIEQVPVAVNDSWTPAKVKAYRLSVNKMAEKAEWDLGYLSLEMEELEEFNYDLQLTGFNNLEIENIKNFNNVVENHKDEWKDMPEFEQPSQQAFKRIVVHFKDQQAVDEFSELVNQKVTDKTKFIWYPEINIVKASDKIYDNES